VANRGTDTEDWWDALPRAAWANYPLVTSPHPWFEVHKVAPGVFAIYEPGQFEEVISYLILGDSKALQFDTGLGIGDIRQVVTALTDLPVTVLNSHTHYDHIGGNHAFDSLIGMDTAYTASRTGGLSHDKVAEFVSPGWLWKPTPEGFDPATYATRPFHINSFIADGDQIDLGGRTLEIITTPGHAPDSICLLDRHNRLLFTGDTFYLAPLYTYSAGADFDAYVTSTAKLLAVNDAVDLLLPGHNEPTPRGEYLVRLRTAFLEVAGGHASFELTDGHRQYDFGEFSIITGNDN
jgi:glyoxylase-like metal-dependent hydrolase (beta-lactamase superfamily II)